MVKPLETVSTEVSAPVPNDSERHDAALPLMVGGFGPVKFASPMTASTVDEGTPAVQLAAVLHAVLEVPFHDVCPNVAKTGSSHAKATVIIFNFLIVFVCVRQHPGPTVAGAVRPSSNPRRSTTTADTRFTDSRSPCLPRWRCGGEEPACYERSQVPEKENVRALVGSRRHERSHNYCG